MSSPEAFDLLRHWLQPTTAPSHYHDYIRLVRLFHETEKLTKDA